MSSTTTSPDAMEQLGEHYYQIRSKQERERELLLGAVTAAVDFLTLEQPQAGGRRTPYRDALTNALDTLVNEFPEILAEAEDA